MGNASLPFLLAPFSPSTYARVGGSLGGEGLAEATHGSSSQYCSIGPVSQD